MSETTEPVAPTTTEPVQGADSPEEKGILRDLQADLKRKGFSETCKPSVRNVRH